MNPLNLDYLREHVTKLKLLLDDPQPGLSVWHEMYYKEMQSINDFWENKNETPKLKKIDTFDGLYFFLSNFYPCEIVYKDLTFLSSESAYQAAKLGLDKIEDWKQFTLLTASQSKKLGQKIQIRSDWNKVRINIMQEILSIKFQNPELREKLLLTGDALLIEGNYWNDFFWGVCNGRGQNHLGELLMQLRAKIKLERKLE